MLKRLRELFIKKAKTTRAKAPSTAAADEAARRAPAPAERAEPPSVHHGPTVVHRPIAAQDLDPEAVKIIRRLTRFDHTAYLVGGCVRDLLLDRKPKDYDIATSATPRTVKRSFSNCRIIGRRFRLAHIYFQDGKFIEVATFRARDVREADDAGEGSGAPEEDQDLLIRDDNVFGTPEEDALRRDFTINQLFYDVNSGNVIDHADGLGDLRRRLVRTIGDPEIRFREDPIRILRAVKFAARLDFGIEARTLGALRRTRNELPKAATPRILEEVNRFCRGGAARRSFDLLFETEVFEIVFPELADAYAPGSEERRYLSALLDAVDARGDGPEIGTGEIFAALLLPILAPEFGWGADGSVASARPRVDPRARVDAVLRPIALRLRVARKDQERCRQAMAILQRMVPFKTTRRGFRLALARRPGFADALWMLETAAALHGGELRESLEGWTARATETAPPRAPRPHPAPEAEEVGEGPAPAGRRRRRRRRGKGPGGEVRPDAEAAPAPAAQAPARRGGGRPQPKPPEDAEPAKKLPSKWSDDYFFAALPTVPKDLGLEEDGRDRYGARQVAAEASRPDDDETASAVGPDDSGEDPVAEGATEAGAAPKRRRRRRRRRGRGGGGSASESAGEPEA